MGTPSKGRRVNATVLYPTTEITMAEFRRLSRLDVEEEPPPDPETAQSPPAAQS